jgi:hypothetical protein
VTPSEANSTIPLAYDSGISIENAISYLSNCKGKRSYRLLSMPLRGVKDFSLETC